MRETWRPWQGELPCRRRCAQPAAAALCEEPMPHALTLRAVPPAPTHKAAHGPLMLLIACLT